jgi:hypothetical protein
MTAYCIFMDSVCEGKIPAWRSEDGRFLLHATEREAQLAIADDIMEKLRQFQVGERDFEDAIAIEDYIEPVSVRGDGTFCDLEGNSFGPSEILVSAESSRHSTLPQIPALTAVRSPIS